MVRARTAKKKTSAPENFGLLMAFVRTTWGAEHAPRNGSIVKQLWRKWGERDVEAMVRGAALLGWADLRAINAKEGLGRRMAIARYWQEENAPRKAKLPDAVKSILRAMSE